MFCKDYVPKYFHINFLGDSTKGKGDMEGGGLCLPHAEIVKKKPGLNRVKVSIEFRCLLRSYPLAIWQLMEIESYSTHTRHYHSDQTENSKYFNNFIEKLEFLQNCSLYNLIQCKFGHLFMSCLKSVLEHCTHFRMCFTKEASHLLSLQFGIARTLGGLLETINLKLTQLQAFQTQN